MYAYLLEVDAYVAETTPWIISTGAWDDSATWIDTEAWRDSGSSGSTVWDDSEEWNDSEVWSDSSSSGTTTLRLATHTIVTRPGETPENVIYDGRITEAGSFSKSLVSQGRLGRASDSWGFITLANSDGGLDHWLDYGFAGRAFRLKELATTPQKEAAQEMFVYLFALEELLKQEDEEEPAKVEVKNPALGQEAWARI